MAPAVCSPSTRRHRRPLALALLVMAVAIDARATDSEEDLFFKSVSEISDGELRFLDKPPGKPAHHHRNHIVIDETSVDTGWIKLSQCHADIDPVASSQIVYGEGRIRDIRVTQVENIGRAWVSNHTVQLENIAPKALICVEAESLALHVGADDTRLLINGPYMRRFLDGYYPMHVSMDVRIDTPTLVFDEILPPAQPGFQVETGADTVGYDTWFEGILRTIIRFRRVAPAARP